MSAARIIYPPLSGRDRRHYTRELRKAEQAYETARREAEAAHQAAAVALARAQRLDCAAWSALQFIGGPEEPSPTIAAALAGGCVLLEVQCRTCNHAENPEAMKAIVGGLGPNGTLMVVGMVGPFDIDAFYSCL
jgi:hypothetical protein